jgi:hypothetical protein
VVVNVAVLVRLAIVQQRVRVALAEEGRREEQVSLSFRGTLA